MYRLGIPVRSRCDETGNAPQSDQGTHRKQPPGPAGPELACAPRGVSASGVLDDRKRVAEHHCRTHRENHLGQQIVESEQLCDIHADSTLVVPASHAQSDRVRIAMKTIKMRTRRQIPQVGLGVYKSEPGPTTRNAVLAALEAGYRHIDTAMIYNNEPDVGEAIKASGVDRSEVFVTTKLWNDDHGYDNTLAAFDRSISQLGLDYVDLYLIHWPVPVLRLDTWRALERLTLDGRVRDIGVSNYLATHINEILEYAPVVPAVNQIELSPYLYRTRLDTIELCREIGIVVEAYSPLTKGRKLDDAVLAGIGNAHGKSAAQVLIRWAIQHDFVVLPKSVNPDRIAQNCAVFDFSLTDDEMTRLDSLDEGLVTGWDPADVA